MTDIWNRPPAPLRGDDSNVTTFAAVGAALSKWELIEAHLSLLFGYMVAGGDSDIVRRAYGSVISFQGRRNMVKEAAVSYFRTRPNAALQEEFGHCLSDLGPASARRNDIAHGIVQPFIELGAATGEMKGFVLIPSYAAGRHRDENWQPDYYYSSVEIEAFTAGFDKLADETLRVVSHIIGNNRQG